MFKDDSWGEKAKARYEKRKKAGYFAKYARTYRLKHPDRIKARVRKYLASPANRLKQAEANRKNREVMRERLNRLKTECSSCGYDKCKWALHFHHLDRATKNGGISERIRFNPKDLEMEIKKCVLLCANCHAEEEYRRFISNQRE